MALKITLELSAELEKKLREGIAHRDIEQVNQLLVKVFAPTIEQLFQQLSSPVDKNEFESLADQLANALIAYFPNGTPSLSDYAVSRADI
ncbi:MAG: hypothetical protein NT075_04585 [Chloroflexi bacterium]|nr:hypothetical protein [Chloroflexota bacterium]